MKSLVISDAEYNNDTYIRLHDLVCEYLSGIGCEIEEIVLNRETLKSCMGCFGCWIKTPGECVIKDDIGRINKTNMNSNVVVYLCPVVFGQYSANMKNAIDRWLPNMLPFFVTRPDGSTMHPRRYESYPTQIMIGYGESLSQADAELFIDIIKKHRSNVEAFIYNGNGEGLAAFLGSVELKRVGGSL